MGISGLIPFLEKASSKVNLRDIRGACVAVDTYCWLHKGVFCCAEKLVRGEETDKYLQYCLKYVQMLLANDIKPIMVFDGRHLPAKAQTELRRRESRQTSKRLAAELLRAGRTEEARSHMRRCVDVTHEMALRLIRECRLRNVDCIVAPYEADAQLAWLNKVGLAQYVITEDSDLLLFGAQKIIFKLDLTGAGLLIESDKLHLAMGCTAKKYTFDKFRRMCILSGCDYLDSLPGIGLAKACKFILKTEEDNMRRALKKIPAYLNMRQLEVSDEYIEGFLKAEATFRHMYIYNALERRMERLNALKDFDTDESLCCNAGSLLTDEEQAFQLAIGNLHPFKLTQLDTWHPNNRVENCKSLPAGALRDKHKSIWDRSDEIEQQTEKPGKQHALIFKKVDFLSKKVEEEVIEAVSAECAKPAEADIFNIYSCVQKKPLAKLTSPNEKQNTTNKKNLNPFVKSDASISHTSPTVCESPSLLKVLTPERCKLKSSETSSPSTIELTPKSSSSSTSKFTDFSASPLSNKTKTPQKRAQGIKRSLFAQKTESGSQPTVKSRFFVQPKPAAEQIESSPLKKIIRLDPVMPTNKNMTFFDIATKTINNNNNSTITLLSDEEEAVEQKSHTSAAKLAVFQKQNAPRLGLSRPKSAAKSKINKTANTTSTDTQSLLSKFGFQRKPVLK